MAPDEVFKELVKYQPEKKRERKGEMKEKTTLRQKTRTGFLLTVALIAAALSGCAYFNTFYNAKRYYNEGLKKEETKKGSGKSKFSESLKKAVIVARDYPDSRWVDDAFFLMAMDYYWMENYDKAEVQFEGFLEHFPDSKYAEEARYYHALALVKLKKYAKGRMALQELFSSRRFDAEARFAWAEAFYLEEEWDEAKDAFGDFLKKNPHGELAKSARLNLAEIQLKSGDTLSAIKTYERFLRRAETSEENFERSLTLAELYYLNGDYKDARKTLNKIPKGMYTAIDQACDLLKAKIDLATGDTTSARRVLAKIPYGDQRAEAFFILASTYEVDGEFEKAVAYYDTIATRETRSNYAALAKRKMTLLESSFLESDSADTVQVDPASEQFLLAQTYMLGLGDAPRAVEEYQKVVSNYPESSYAPKALYGIIWLKKFRLNDSLWLTDYYRLLESYPHSDITRDARELLADEETDIELPENELPENDSLYNDSPETESAESQSQEDISSDEKAPGDTD